MGPGYTMALALMLWFSAALQGGARALLQLLAMAGVVLLARGILR